MKADKCNKGVFSCIILLQIRWAIWAQIFTGLLFYAYVGTHQVRTLVFDNYPKGEQDLLDKRAPARTRRVIIRTINNTQWFNGIRLASQRCGYNHNMVIGALKAVDTYW